MKTFITTFSLLFGMILMSVVQAATFSVTNTNDMGSGSLRQAMLDANDGSGLPADVIEFNIPNTDPNCVDVDGALPVGNHVCTITLATKLPTITDSVKMDGSITETRMLPGSPTKRPGVEINLSFIGPVFQGPSGLPLFSNGLSLFGPAASGSEIRGLIINGFNGLTSDACAFEFFNPSIDLSLCGAGIFLFAANNVNIAGNYLGLDKQGVTRIGNPVALLYIVDASNNVIGGYTSNDRNVGSGSGNLTLARADFSAIKVILTGWASDIRAFGAPKNVNFNKVVGNYIGLTAEGVALHPRAFGITLQSWNIEDDASGVPGSVGFGAKCADSDPEVLGHCEMRGNIIEGNTITYTSGCAGVCTGGISVFNYNENTVVTGNNVFAIFSDPAFPFTINAYVRVGSLADEGPVDSPEPKKAVNMEITNNQLGVDQNGAPFGFGEVGIYITAGDSILIKNNTVTGGALGGIFLEDNTPIGASLFPNNITISQNSIYGNDPLGLGALGINLTQSFSIFFELVTPNDAMDLDLGVNNFQNYPVLTQISFNPAVAFLTGTLNSRPNSLYVIEFFSNDELHILGHGEGKSFLTSRVVSTDANGDASFAVPYNDIHGEFLTDPGGKTYITATATAKFCEDDGVTCKPGSTSEFSKACEADLSALAKFDTIVCAPDPHAP